MIRELLHRIFPDPQVAELRRRLHQANIDHRREQAELAGRLQAMARRGADTGQELATNLAKVQELSYKLDEAQAQLKEAGGRLKNFQDHDNAALDKLADLLFSPKPRSYTWRTIFEAANETRRKAVLQVAAMRRAQEAEERLGEALAQIESLKREREQLEARLDNVDPELKALRAADQGGG